MGTAEPSSASPLSGENNVDAYLSFGRRAALKSIGQPYDPGVLGRILSLVAAESGWRAIYGEDSDDRELTRIVAWALVEDADGSQRLVGMVVDAADPTQIVAAPSGASAIAPTFDRYGFKEH